MNLLLLEELEKDNSITLGRGNIISKEEMQQYPGDFPVYSSSATKNGEFGRYGKYMFEDERITWSIDGGGRLFYRNNHKYSVTNVCGWLKVNNPNFSTKFIYYCLIFQWSHLKFDYTYKAHPSVIRKMYKIPVIDLSTQLKIVDELDKINQNIKKETNAFEYYEELIKSRFIEMFGDVGNNNNWELCTIPEACRNILGGGTPSKSKPEYFEGNIPWVTPKDMKSIVIKDSIDHITEEAIQNSSTNLIPSNSVLMVVRSGILKHTLPLAINDVPVTINQDMKAFIPTEKISSEFLLYYFKSIEDDVLSGVRRVTADNIDFKAFQKRKIFLPPIELQNEFAEFVKLTDKLKFDDYSRNFL